MMAEHHNLFCWIPRRCFVSKETTKKPLNHLRYRPLNWFQQQERQLTDRGADVEMSIRWSLMYQLQALHPDSRWGNFECWWPNQAWIYPGWIGEREIWPKPCSCQDSEVFENDNEIPQPSSCHGERPHCTHRPSQVGLSQDDAVSLSAAAHFAQHFIFCRLLILGLTAVPKRLGHVDIDADFLKHICDCDWMDVCLK